MIRNRISGLPVINQQGRIAGIITEGDLLRRTEIGTERERSGWLSLFISPGRLAEDFVLAHARRVGEVMTTQVATVASNTPLAEVVALMESRRIKRLPIVDDERLVGIISRADLLRALAKLLPETPAPAVSDAELRERVLQQIAKQASAPRASIDARVQDGVVELSGAITNVRERDALTVVTENTPGVKSVRDHLVWVEPISGMVIEAPQKD